MISNNVNVCLKQTTLFVKTRLLIKTTTMKHLLAIVVFLGFLSGAKAQTNTEHPVYFAQCMINLDDQETFTQLEQSLRDNPYVKIVRLDWISKRAFLLTKDIDAFSKEQFRSWLGAHADAASCIQVGQYTIDPINPYPFTNCDNE